MGNHLVATVAPLIVIPDGAVWSHYISTSTVSLMHSHCQSRTTIKPLDATHSVVFFSFCPSMSLLQGVISQVLTWDGFCHFLYVLGTGLVAVVAAWTVKLLVRHAWYTHRLSCFSKPHANSWLIGHLGQVGHVYTTAGKIH